jgi:hypothetical protein
LITRTKLCIGSAGRRCPRKARVQDWESLKRCSSCAKAQKLIVVRKSQRKHWRKYKARRIRKRKEMARKVVELTLLVDALRKANKALRARSATPV